MKTNAHMVHGPGCTIKMKKLLLYIIHLLHSCDIEIYITIYCVVIGLEGVCVSGNSQLGGRH